MTVLLRYFSAMRTIGVLLLPGTRVFEFGVTCEVWMFDRTSCGLPSFELRFVAPGGRRQTLHPMGEATPTHGLDGLTGCDLVLAPGRADPHAPVTPQAVHALRAAHESGSTVASLCSGAFTLAAAGLLDGVEATTHWALLDDLEAAAPTSAVRRDVLFTDAGRVLTSAGVVGGLDLCLHLVRRDHGAEAAAALARRLVMPPVRDGGQRQYVEADLPRRPERSGIASTMDWAVDRLAEPIGVADMAAQAGLGARTFQREFTAAAGTTPGRWLRLQRIGHARRLLKTTDLTVGRVAEYAGLGTAANLRRRLLAEVGVGPGSYRRTFHQPPEPVLAGPR